MGVVRTCAIKRSELDIFHRNLVAAAGIHRRKDDEGLRKNKLFSSLDDEDVGKTLVCVTSGVSYLGLALVNHLLVLGYSVRIIVDNPGDREKLREIRHEEMRNNLEIIIAKLNDVDSLVKAFEGCRGIFHTSAFTDPAGLSGYTKSMAEIEVNVTENVMEACARTPSIKRCVFTSSLAACIWQDNVNSDLTTPIINHGSWSSESLCIDKKLWYALGKMRAEKAAWRIANERGLKLTTICPALITGPEFCHRNPTATIAYLKGAQKMYSNGLLATVDVKKVAEAHACVFKEMNENAYGRYICFDNVIDAQSEAEKLAKDIGMPKEKICGDASNISLQRYELSNNKLCRLMSRPIRCSSEN
ncbi:putative cinnamoyl-CoA reductase [Medicago truncatula]|uniref:Cinnamoyl-CoA reductase n=1 Tax=Medicago truncatula TaxID=3880 RepID=A0A072U6Q4_MEDTR|nr:cinnamoyl-CoA reductase-like SNL6 [Medicago truncatula]KEH24813.1 cinnamoyl-CoA reductase [Medicago truncatula]RHN49775.1 putative cinnamoyl-CoA reductase [Medicago truncatula]